MRRGEVVGLRWSTVDLGAARVQVRYTITQVRCELVERDGAKTEAGERTIALDPKTVEALRDHRRRQREERLAAGERWTESDRVFTDELLRGCRLVIDTGVHHLGWSRQQALDYLLANAPVSEPFAVAEVNRVLVTRWVRRSPPTPT